MTYYHIEFRRGTAAEWTSANPVLNAGEPGYETDTTWFKIGDGINTWSNLPYQPTGSYLSIFKQAKDPDLIITGNITRDSNENVTSADVVWGDGTPGTYTVLSTDPTSGAVNSYQITYGNPATHTFTQPTITRDSSGAATYIPAITES